MWSDRLTFSSSANFVPSTPGTPWEGGFYTGRIMVYDTAFAIVVASKLDGGELNSVQWKTSSTSTSNASSTFDSHANMQAAINSGIARHPAFQFCRNFRGGGYGDWVLGAKDVMEIVYRNLKPSGAFTNHTASGVNLNSIPPTGHYTANDPSHTAAAAFKEGGVEAFGTTTATGSRFWTSTQNGPTQAWYQDFANGLQDANTKTWDDNRSVRPVRLVPIG